MIGDVLDIDKAIKIRCGGEKQLLLSELNFFQKKLKTIDIDKFKDLKESLIADGLPLGFHVWVDPKKNRYEIMDGHHRYLALVELEKEGWFVPSLPCNTVIAANKKEAAKIVLISNARYAKMNQESLANYMIDFELQLPDLKLLDFADLDLKDFKIDVDFEAGSEDNQGKLDELSPKIIECPHCGESFDQRKA